MNISAYQDSGANVMIMDSGAVQRCPAMLSSKVHVKLCPISCKYFKYGNLKIIIKCKSVSVMTEKYGNNLNI